MLIARCAWHAQYHRWWPKRVPFVTGVKRGGRRRFDFTDGCCRGCAQRLLGEREPS